MQDETLELHFATINKSIDKLDKNNREAHTEIFSEIKIINTDVATLKVKSGIWGFIAGIIPATITLIVLYIKNTFK